MSTRKRSTEPKPKKQCQGVCGKMKAHTFFYKVDSPMFPDGMINICRDCVRQQVDTEDVEQVINFLRQIDKPFVEKYWTESVQSGKNPLGEYIRKINSLQQMKGKTFNDSDHMSPVTIKKAEKTIEKETVEDIESPDYLLNVNDEPIVFSQALANKWGAGYEKHEYLKMEKFYQDMEATHKIETSIHIDYLTQLSYMSIERDRLRQIGDWQNYPKISKTIEDMIKSAGFRPVDRQSIDDATGIKTFAQIWEKVEKEGWRKPPVAVFNEDVVDGQMIALLNYYHRLVGKQILSEIPDEVKEELDAFYEFDATPVEINDEEYEDLDFSIEEEEEDDE